MRKLFVNSSVRRAMVGCLIGVVLLTSPGCYGRFPATNAVYRWNGDVTNSGFVNSIILIVLVIIPVYEVCMIVDAIILNSIAFWSGEQVHISQSTTMPDGSVATLSPGINPDEAILTVTRDGKLVALRTYVHTDKTHTNILNEKGEVVSVVEHAPLGGLLVRDPSGSVVAEYRKSELAALTATTR